MQSIKVMNKHRLTLKVIDMEGGMIAFRRYLKKKRHVHRLRARRLQATKYLLRNVLGRSVRPSGRLPPARRRTFSPPNRTGIKYAFLALRTRIEPDARILDHRRAPRITTRTARTRTCGSTAEVIHE